MLPYIVLVVSKDPEMRVRSEPNWIKIKLFQTKRYKRVHYHFNYPRPAPRNSDMLRYLDLVVSKDPEMSVR